MMQLERKFKVGDRVTWGNRGTVIDVKGAECIVQADNGSELNLSHLALLFDYDRHDLINAPAHYTSGGIETIDFIEAKELGYHLGNVVKYVSRAGRKGDKLEDLKKARWYLDRAIKEAEKT